MNTELEQLAATLHLSSEAARPLALAFGLACAKRAEHLLEVPAVQQCLDQLERYVQGNLPAAQLAAAAQEAERLANHHSGSKSIDGCGHAAVSASYGVSNALAGKAMEAASYCAYALVYASGGYAAVAQREAFDTEFAWQANCLRELTTSAIVKTEAI